MPDSPANKPDLTLALHKGGRLMIRRRLSPDEIAEAAGTLDATKTLTDVVGDVIASDGTTVTLRTRRQGDVTIPRGDVVAAKAIPPTPERRRPPQRAIGTEALEEIMVDGWAPQERHWAGRWLLRAAGGYTGRANSCLILGEPDRTTTEALDLVAHWYASRTLTPMLQVPLAPGAAPHDIATLTPVDRPGTISDPLVETAEATGWEWFRPTLVMTAATAAVCTATTAATRNARTEVSVTPTLESAWWSLADSRQRRAETAARAVLTASPEQRFVTISDDRGPCARGRIVFAHGWGGIAAVETREDARRHGHAHAVMRTCASEAAHRDLASLYLQVSADNTAAITLYEALGFTTHHTYLYLRPRQSSEPIASGPPSV